MSLRNHLTVKNVLLQRPDLVEEYSNVKRRLAKQTFKGIGNYGAEKSTVIQKILAAGDLEEETLAAIAGHNQTRSEQK